MAVDSLPKGFTLDEAALPDEPSIPYAEALPQGFILSEDEERQHSPLPEQVLNLGMEAIKGATVGLAPKAMAGMGALAMKGPLEAAEFATKDEFQAPSLGDIYKGLYSGIERRHEQSLIDNPILTPMAEVGGGLVGGYGAGKSLGQGVAKVKGIMPALPAVKNPLTQKALRALGKVGAASGVGGTSMGVYSAGTAPIGEEKQAFVEGVPIGMKVGAAAPLITGGVQKLIPKADEGLKEIGRLAKKHNIPLSLSQITQTRPIKNIQKISQELPFSGWDEFRGKQLSTFNKALTKTFGQESDSISTKVMDKAFKDVGDEFDNLAKGKTFTVGSKIDDAVSDILEDQTAYTDDAIKAFQKEIDVIKKNVSGDDISGEKLNFLRSRMNRLARKTKDSDKSELFRDAENIIIDLMTEGDEIAKAGISSTKQKYKNLLVIEPLAAKGKGGNINPTLLNNRVSKIYGRQHVRGKSGEIGELARIGNELLPELGGSDTVSKSIYTGMGVLGLGAIDPATGTLAATALGGNKAYQSWLNQNQKIISKTLEDNFKKAMSDPATAAALSAGVGATGEE
jgi:hypothetical protein